MVAGPLWIGNVDRISSKLMKMLFGVRFCSHTVSNRQTLLALCPPRVTCTGCDVEMWPGPPNYRRDLRCTAFFRWAVFFLAKISIEPLPVCLHTDFGGLLIMFSEKKEEKKHTQYYLSPSVTECNLVC